MEFSNQWLVGLFISVVLIPVLNHIFSRINGAYKRIDMVEGRTDELETKVQVLTKDVDLSKNFLQQEIKGIYKALERIEKKLDS